MKSIATILLLAFSAGISAAQDAAPAPPELTVLMERVRERVIQYYTDLQKYSWIDRVQYEWSNAEGKIKTKSREVVYDQIIRLQEPQSGQTDTPFNIREQSELKSVDGKVARKGQTRRDEDPFQASLSELGFLTATGKLAENRSYSYGGQAALDGRIVLLLDLSVPETRPPEVVVDKKFVGIGVRSEFWVHVQLTKARVWIDAETDDVLQLEWRTVPFYFEFRGKKLTYTRVVNSRYRNGVPDTLEDFVTIKGRDFPFHRTTHKFADYKRFTGDVKITPLGDATRR